MTEEYFFKEGCYITELYNTPLDPEVSIAQARVKPGQTTQWHSLLNTTERFLITSGQGLAEKDSSSVELKQGDSYLIPSGVRQRITNTGDKDLVFLAICTPRFEEKNYFEESSK